MNNIDFNKNSNTKINFHNSLINKKTTEKLKKLSESLINKLFANEEEIKNNILNDVDEEIIRKNVDQHRLLAAKLEDIGIDYNKIYTSENDQEKLAIDEIRIYIKFWCSRILEFETNEQSFEDLNFCNYFLDHKLPEKMDPENDQIILLSPKNNNLIELIINKNFKKIIIFNKNGTKCDIKNKKIISISSIENLKEYLLREGQQFTNRIHVVDNFLTNNKDEETKKILELIEKNFLVQFFNKNTKIVYNESFTKNTLKNLFYSKNLKILNSIHYEGIKTAVIVGAGPSLNKNINILKKNKDKVLVISCLHALPALIRNKIDPDIVLHIHGKDAEGFLKILKSDSKKPIKNLILSSVVNPEVFNLPADNIFHFPFTYYCDLFNNYLDTSVGEYLGSNVILTTISFLKDLGIKNISLIGNDLSFPNDEFYAKDSEFQPAIIKEKFRLSQNKIQVKGYDGGFVNTSRTFSIYIDEFNKLAEKLKKEDNNLKLFNSSEGGALIENFENINLDKFISKYGKKGEKKITSNFNNNAIKNVNSKILKFLLNNKSDLEIALKILKMLIKIRKNNFSKQNAERNGKLIQELISLTNNNWFLGLSSIHLTMEFNLINKGHLDIISSHELFTKMYNNFESMKKIINSNIKNKFKYSK